MNRRDVVLGESIAGMKASYAPNAVREFFLSIFGPGVAMLSWVGRQIWDWTVLSFAVLALWSFGGIVAGLAVAEVIPSAVELVGAATMLSVGTIALGLRVCFAAWRSNELMHAGQRISITILIVSVVCVITVTGDKYLVGKIPSLYLRAYDLAPRALMAPQPIKEVGASRKPLAKPRSPLYPISFLGIRLNPAQKPTQPPGILILYKNNTGGPLTVQIKHLVGLNFQMETPEQRDTYEEATWAQMIATTAQQQELHSEQSETYFMFDANVDFPMDSLAKKHDSYFFIEVQSVDGKRLLLNLCGYLNSSGGFTYCKHHNWP